MANTYLSRTTSTAGNGQKFTFSAWVKRSLVGSGDPSLFCCGAGNSSQADQFFFGWNDGGASRDKLSIQQYNGTPALRTNRRFRDVNAWYHIVLAVDTTQATDTNRLKLYVNGVQETSFADTNYPTQNYSYAFGLGTSKVFVVGAAYFSSYGRFFDGSMSHVHFIDGTAYDASAFGETDSTTGEWKIKTSPSVTYGTNGFFILKDGNTITDSSTNSNNFSLGGGTLTKTEDCPDNVFATMNPLDNYYTNSVFSNGNNSITTNNNARTFNNSTLGMTSGKYYCEMKSAGVDAGAMVGIIATSSTGTTFRADVQPYSWQYINTGSMRNNNNTQSGTWNTWTSGDIIGIALDLDNSKIYFSKNGVWQNTGSTNPSTGTDGFSITAVSSLPGDQAGCYFFNCSDNSTSSNLSYFNWNFGNGYFGTTAVSSAGTNASGNGIFEYDTPTGFTALSTKGLNL